MIKIPDEALEAGARALARYNCAEFDKNPDRWARYFMDEAGAAIKAALGAWPGAYEEYMNDEDGEGARVCVILPKDGGDE
tara:strand:- start:282 stop:521 length:240 start_codon:yes stop_codon:yes gene_type:complete